MLEAGKLVGTRLMEMPREVLTDSVPGKAYHLTIKTKGIANEEEVAEALVNKLYENFKAEVVWVKIENGVIDLQLIGSPFAWAALIAYIPLLLTLFGILLIGVAIYSVLAAIPSWAWGVLAIGVLLIFIAPTAATAAKGMKRA